MPAPRSFLQVLRDNQTKFLYILAAFLGLFFALPVSLQGLFQPSLPPVGWIGKGEAREAVPSAEFFSARERWSDVLNEWRDARRSRQGDPGSPLAAAGGLHLFQRSVAEKAARGGAEEEERARSLPDAAVLRLLSVLREARRLGLRPSRAAVGQFLPAEDLPEATAEGLHRLRQTAEEAALLDRLERSLLLLRPASRRELLEAWLDQQARADVQWVRLAAADFEPDHPAEADLAAWHAKHAGEFKGADGKPRPFAEVRGEARDRLLKEEARALFNREKGKGRRYGRPEQARIVYAALRPVEIRDRISVEIDERRIRDYYDEHKEEEFRKPARPEKEEPEAPAAGKKKEAEKGKEEAKKKAYEFLPYEEVRERIRRQLAEEDLAARTEQEIERVAGRVREDVAAGTPFPEAARKAGLAPVEPGPRDRAGIRKIPSEAQVFADAEPFVQAVFSKDAKDERRAERFEGFFGSLLWQLLERLPEAEGEPTDEALGRARTDLLAEKSLEIAKERLEEIRKGTAGKPLGEAVKGVRDRLLASPGRKDWTEDRRKPFLAVQALADAARGGDEPAEAGEGDPPGDAASRDAILAAAFKATPPGLAEPVEREGVVFAVWVAGVRRPDVEAAFQREAARREKAEAEDASFDRAPFEAGAKATEAEARAHYEAHKDEFKDGGRVRAALLLLPRAEVEKGIEATEAEARALHERESPPTADASSREADFQVGKGKLLRRIREQKLAERLDAREKEVEAALRSPGADPVKAAKGKGLEVLGDLPLQRQADLAAKAGELLGDGEPGADLASAAFAGKTGEASKPLRGPKGIAWAVPLERRDPAVAPFEEIRKDAEEAASREKAGAKAKGAAAEFAEKVRKDPKAWDKAAIEAAKGSLAERPIQVDHRGAGLPAGGDAKAREARAKAVFELAPGALLPPFEAEAGKGTWHVLRRKGAIPLERKAFDEELDKALRSLWAERAYAFVDAWWERFRERAPVEWNPKAGEK